jgi:hypothetical protein
MSRVRWEGSASGIHESCDFENPEIQMAIRSSFGSHPPNRNPPIVKAQRGPLGPLSSRQLLLNLAAAKRLRSSPQLGSYNSKACSTAYSTTATS